MLRLSGPCLARSFRRSLKYPSLVSYNKLPWEVINHETIALHRSVAGPYEQLLALAATTDVPHIAAAAHPQVEPHRRLQTLPGTVYLLPAAAAQVPQGFTAHAVTDPAALQYYGRLAQQCGAPVSAVRLLTSDDLRLLCLAVEFGAGDASAATAAAPAPRSSLSKVADAAGGGFTLFHYFRPNRSASELTRPLERFYVHRPVLAALDGLGDGAAWEPRLRAPQRKAHKFTPPQPYAPPQSYLMGLAERMAVVPGNSFGRRSLMWGHWF